MCDNELTMDSLFHGHLKVLQKTKGYRFSVDAVILAHFPIVKKSEIVLDLGCGCGIIPLIIAYRHPEVQLFGLELQEELFLLASENARLNGLEDRIRILRGDLRVPEKAFEGSFADWIVCNPPYRRKLSGRLNLDSEKAMARHEVSASLPQILKAAAFFLKPGGRLAIIYPARRSAGLLSGLHTVKLEPKRLQIVYSYPGGEGILVLVEARKNSGEELKILPPFFIYNEDRGYSEAMAALYEQRG